MANIWLLTTNRANTTDYTDLQTDIRRPVMTIGSALERGSLIYVFDENGRTLFSKACGSGLKDGLLGFTGSTVTVRFGSVIYTYDESGMTLYAKAA
jgi:hypothetical protein